MLRKQVKTGAEEAGAQQPPEAAEAAAEEAKGRELKHVYNYMAYTQPLLLKYQMLT